MDKLQVQAEVARRVRALRRIERILEHPIAIVDDHVVELINNFDDVAIEKYFFSTFAQEMETMSLRHLRAKAKAYHVPYYTLLSRVELIRAIHEFRRNNEEGNTDRGSAGDTVRPSDDQVSRETPASGSSVS